MFRDLRVRVSGTRRTVAWVLLLLIITVGAFLVPLSHAGWRVALMRGTRNAPTVAIKSSSTQAMVRRVPLTRALRSLNMKMSVRQAVGTKQPSR